MGIPISAICVQEFDDSQGSAIHITYRSSRRSSSMAEPRHPLLKVVLVMNILFFLFFYFFKIIFQKKIKNKKYIRLFLFTNKKGVFFSYKTCI